jgi:hypothetical protein
MAAEERNQTGLRPRVREFVSFYYVLVLSGYVMKAELTVKAFIVACASTRRF